MGVLGERPDPGGGGGGGGGGELAGRGLQMELDDRHCVTCGRLLHPWEDVCPDDGGAPGAANEVQHGHDPLLARLLAEETDDTEADTGAGDDAPDGGAGGELDWPDQ